MKNLWIMNVLTLSIAVVDTLFFQWLFGGDISASLLFTFFFFVFASFFLFIAEGDKRWFVTAGFSVLAVWLSLKAQSGFPIFPAMNMVMDLSMTLFAAFLVVVLVMAKDIEDRRSRFLMLASEIAHCGLVFGAIQLTCFY